MEQNKHNISLRDSTSLSSWQSIEVNTSASFITAKFDAVKVYDCLIIGAGITGICAH